MPSAGISFPFPDKRGAFIHQQQNSKAKNKAKPLPSLTLEGSVGFFEKGSEVNGSLFSGFLKKSSGAEVRNGSLSLKGSPPNGSGRKIKWQGITTVNTGRLHQPQVNMNMDRMTDRQV